MAVYGGVDVGLGHFFACAIDLEKGSVRFPDGATSLGETLSWLHGMQVENVCIDAPPQPNQGLLATRLGEGHALNANRRIAEFRLGIGGCYGTPSSRPDPAATNGWMVSGMDLFDALKERRQWRIDLGSGEGELFETHPTYGFRALLGVRDIESRHDLQRHLFDPGRKLRPKRPKACGGHSQRIELLVQALQEAEIRITPDVQERWERSIDFVDATFCALLACWRGQRRASVRAYGDPAEGSIYLYIPDESWRVTEYPVSIRQSTSRPSQRGPARLDPPPNSIILRLGEQGPGGLSQFETIEHAWLGFDKGECWIPIGTNHRFRLEERLAQVGRVLFLAFKNELRLRITTGSVRFQPHQQLPYPGTHNPWPISSAQGWIEALDVQDVSLTNFKAVHKGQWASGFTARGANLLMACVDEQ